ncbi:MAG TPA: hypothetical protein VFA56_09170 [Gaiellaceae bacterium]|nr:hypothetical protein [Gaiellaceae bacterium]
MHGIVPTVKRLLCVLVLAGVAAGPAAGKLAPRAHLLAPLPTSARAGALVTVRWTVTVRDAGGARQGFSAIGMVVRLIGRNGASTTAVARENAGPPYSARLRVPAGGIRGVRFGLAGADGIAFFP